MRPEPAWDVATIGELLGVFTPLSNGPLDDARRFDRGTGGAEVNVAIGLARRGHRVRWCGHVGADAFGRDGLRTLQRAGVDVELARSDGDAPTGIYVKELVTPERARACYYRTGSAASAMRFGDLDLDAVLSCRILHLTGITPLLSASCEDLTHRLSAEADDRGVPISFDANIRWALAGHRDPAPILMPLVNRATIVFLAAAEAELLFGTADPSTLPDKLSRHHAATFVVHDRLSAFAVEPDGTVVQRPTRAARVVDPVGAGDAFVAGYLSGWLRALSTSEALRLAHRSAASVVRTRGDHVPLDDGHRARGPTRPR